MSLQSLQSLQVSAGLFSLYSLYRSLQSLQSTGLFSLYMSSSGLLRSLYSLYRCLQVSSVFIGWSHEKLERNYIRPTLQDFVKSYKLKYYCQFVVTNYCAFFVYCGGGWSCGLGLAPMDPPLQTSRELL